MRRRTYPSRAERTRRAILKLLLNGPAMTADALADRLDLPILYVRPRVSELASAQWIVPSGERAPNATGRLAHKWKVA
jgi:predicted ArsR family transcriptional regulator